ncbi:hypothetical protein BK133_12245 [Paenibacillus sp. FSL H8-0548]|uniref:sugar phosphate isomerase/epimerase family protein n=1 Tax=Paenibacillus sp. FSL H8-0548 TaxID=1920422 RepID=UPI00096FB996|nr:sugar phosphate isomerase/epimerase family protein [Paenibacillus sp. FSL H8-0548]OMF34562.1 hypothetical protein BK133_12245 [Paenibacillus sp. FSL H8-0548]
MAEFTQYSISTFALINQPLKEAINQLIEAGWRSIELMCEDGHRELLSWSAEELLELKKLGISKGIAWTIHAPIHGLNPGAASEQSIADSKQCLLQAAKIAAYLNCNYVVLHCGQIPPAEERGWDSQDDREALSRCTAFMKDILHLSASEEVKFALENVPPYPNVLGTKVDFINAIVEAVNDPRLKIVFDVAHAHLLGEGKCLHSLQQVIPHLIGLHINDNLGDIDSHLAVGDGNIPFPAIVALLREQGFKGNWTMETCQVDYAEKSVSRLRNLENLLLFE